ncbi:MAG: succinylglutamate desuccinylase [Candidatus Competibacteraceae bacterium]
MKTTISGLAARSCSDTPAGYHDLGPRARAPRLALVADLGGSELNGMFVLARLAGFLKSIQAGEQPGLRLRERVVIIPAGHALRAQGNYKVRGGLDLINAAGVRVQPVVDELVAITRKAYYRVDIHTTSLDLEEMPQVRLYAPNDDERASACLFELPAVIERPNDHGVASCLVRLWRVYGGENFVIRAGQSGSLQTQHCEVLFRALVVFLDRTGIVSGLKLVDSDEDLRYFGAEQIFVVLAEQSGLFTSRLEVGRWVQAGEELGHVYDSFSGGVKVRVVAPVAGLLASLRRQPLLCEGDLVARILLPTRLAACHASLGRRTA